MTKNILKYAILGLVGLILLLIVFGIVLVLDWPWWVGFFILLGLVGVGIVGYLIRQVLKKKREQLFVSQIIEQNEADMKALQDDERKHVAELQERFKEAVGALKGSHLKKQGNPLYVLPWYMVIGESASGKTTAIKSAKLSSPFAEMTQVSGFSGTKNCDWWFFEQAVIIDTAGRYAIPVDEGKDKDEWQKFLNLLAKYRKKEPLNGLVVAVAADRLLEAPADALEEDGKQIRRRIDELMHVLGSKFPVYLLVTKCDLVQGMTQFTAQLGDEVLQQAFGAINHDLSQDYPGFFNRAMNTIAERLASLRLLIFHKLETRTPDPALLLFPEEFSRLKLGIEVFMKGAFLVNPYQETPMLRGIYFSSGRQEGSPYSHFLKSLGLIEDREVLPGTNKGLFLHDFFAKILPRERSLFAPTRKALAWERLTLNLGLLAWVAIGIAICGILSFSFMKNLAIIRGVPTEFTRQIAFRGEMSTDLEQMNNYKDAILKVQQKNKSWWIPRLGLTESKEAEEQFKHNFCARFDERFLSAYDKQLAVDIKSAAPEDARLGEYVIYLIRRINLIKARLAGEDADALTKRPKVSLASAGQGNETGQRFMDLYAYRLIWEEKGDTLKKESAYLQTLLAEAVTKTPNLHWIPECINADPDLKSVSLKEFWGGSVSAADDIMVAPAFTAAGKGRVDALLVDLETAVQDPQVLAARKAEFQTWYRDTYREAWHNFGLNFGKGVERLGTPDDWSNAVIQAASANGLYFKMLRRMADELKPFNQGTLPDWMKFVYEFDKVQLLAPRVGATAAKATETASKLKEKIQETIGKENAVQGAGKEFDDARALKEYENALSKIASLTARSRPGAFQTAASTFGETASASPFTAAYNAFSRVQAAASNPREPFWRLAYGPYDLMWMYACRESACHLQERWVKEVLIDVEGVTEPAQLNELLFSSEGLVTKFIKGTAAPFLDRGLKKGYFAKQAFGRSIPFDPAFLSFISNARVVRMPPGGGGGSDNNVSISGMPTEANDGARVQPHATKLTLQCMDSQQVLVNRNYPVSKTVTWSSQRCGGVLFAIEVGNLVLSKSYSGPAAFAKFLKEFPGGTHTFAPEDFPNEASQIRALGIRYIKVHYQFSGADAVISGAGPLIENVVVPQTIAVCPGR